MRLISSLSQNRTQKPHYLSVLPFLFSFLPFFSLLLFWQGRPLCRRCPERHLHLLLLPLQVRGLSLLPVLTQLIRSPISLMLLLNSLLSLTVLSGVSSCFPAWIFHQHRACPTSFRAQISALLQAAYPFPSFSYMLAGILFPLFEAL